MATFKHHASATDLRDCQSAVLWEWASSTGLSLPECAAKFSRNYRSFWPLAQLGDPMVKEDRMFSVDQRDVLSILRKQEAQFGTYVTGSMTEEPANAFQRILQGHRIGHSPVWVHNTHAPRAHVEALLRKCTPHLSDTCPRRIHDAHRRMHDAQRQIVGLWADGVPYLPSSAPGCRMIDFFRKRSLIAKPAEASPTARTYGTHGIQTHGNRVMPAQVHLPFHCRFTSALVLVLVVQVLAGCAHARRSHLHCTRGAARRSPSPECG